MVSFQCNGCGDVLTKPKLDKHRAMCHTSFDCIDCSKRFESPADYKGHTSCITEAEKYQGALYNGGSGPERNGRNQRSRQQGGGRQSWGSNRQQWQQRNVNKATGANDTPLGTPVRMSPVNDTPVVDENTQKNRPVTETPKKRKAEPETTGSNDTSEPAKKRKKQKKTDGAPEIAEMKSRKKRKSTSEVTVIEAAPQGPNPQPAEDGDAPKEAGEKKKEKGRKKSKEVKEGEEEETRKEKRKKKKDPSSSGQGHKSGTVAVQPPTEVPPTIDEKTRSTKSRSKLTMIDEAPEVPAPEKPPHPTVSEVGAQDDQAHRKQKKKRQSGNHKERGSDGKRVAEGDGRDLKEICSKEIRKEKKKKRKSEGQGVNVAE